MNHTRMLLAAIVLTGTAAVAETVKVGTFPIPLMVESSTKGVFVELAQKLGAASGLRLDISVTPPKRTVEQFAQGEVDCFFPALEVSLPGKVARSSNIYVKQDFAFSRKDARFTSLNQLKGKTVGITLGYPYVAEVAAAKSFTIAPAPDDVSNMKKLGGGRLDAFIVEEKSGLKALQESGQTNIEYDKSSPISRQDVFFACQDTPAGRAVAEKLSAALKKMQADGTFAAVMAQAR